MTIGHYDTKRACSPYANALSGFYIDSSSAIIELSIADSRQVSRCYYYAIYRDAR